MRNSSSAYIPSLDGLRGISIILVFIAHIGFEHLIPGGLGVTIFFFISGYIITNLIIAEYQNNSSLNLKLFYSRRMLRLYPPLLFMISIYTVYLFFSHAHYNGGEIAAALLYYENYFFFYTPNMQHSFLMILWSLAVEEHFYLLFPLVFLALIKNPRMLVITMVMLIFIPLIFRFIGVLQYGYDKDLLERYTYCLTHTRFDSIIFGCLSAVALNLADGAAYRRFLNSKPAFFAALAIMLFCLVVRNVIFRDTIRYTLQGISLFVIIPAIVNIASYEKLKWLLSNTVLVFIGRLSYSIYLLHMLPVDGLMFLKTNGHAGIYYLAVTAGTALLALMSYYVIEKPCANVPNRLQAPAPALGLSKAI